MNKEKQYQKEIEPRKKNWLMGDYPLWLWVSYNSKIKFMPMTTGVYRVLSVSASHSPIFETNVNFIESAFDIRKFFFNKYHQDLLSLDDILQHQYEVLFSAAFRFKHKKELKDYYRHLKKKSIKIYIKYWIRRHFW